MNLPDFSRYPWLAVDTETAGLKWWKDRAFALSVATPDGRSFYFDLRNTEDASVAPRILADANRLVAHHAKFDAHVVCEYLARFAPQVHVPYNKWRCTMIRAALLDEHRLSYDLDSLAREELGREKHKDVWQELAERFGGKATRQAQAPNLQRAPREAVAIYAQIDAELVAGLYAKQEDDLQEQDLWQVHDLEFRLLPHVIAMEEYGVRVDLEYAAKLSGDLQVEIDKQQRALDKMAGFEVNVNPSNSLKRLVDAKKDTQTGRWIARDGTVLEFTESGGPQMDKNALRRMKMPEAALVLEVRELRRTKETFIDGHVLGHHHEGYIHATINQTKNDQDAGTGTGRFSIQDPALQQIHKRNKKIARMVRPCFLPDDGQVWGCRDWSQMDFRVFAHYAKSPPVLQVYRDDPDADFHAVVAAITGLPRNPDPLTGGGNAKQINLGLVFGMQPGRMAQEMGLPFTKKLTRNGKEMTVPGEEAQAVFAKYHEAVPGVKELLESASNVAKNRGYVLTMMGRRIRFPGGHSTHKAGGLVFQGTAADALKLKMCEVCEYLESRDARLMLVVHDEFDQSLPPGDPEIRQRLEQIINGFEDGPMQFRVPIRSDYGEGNNWAEASL